MTEASTIIEPITVSSEGVTVSALVWGRFLRPSPGVVEAVLAANPGIAESAYIPVGTVVQLPVSAKAQQEPAVAVTRLWD
jgi:phage tail protein X